MKLRVIATMLCAGLFSVLALTAFAQKQPDLSKGGAIHQEVDRLWDNYYRNYYASELQRRLFDDGDVYVLYDLQNGGLQSFVEMTRRTGDTRRMAELVEMVSPVFSVLKPVPNDDQSEGWICTGGSICTAYEFLGKEVALCSVQFLGLVGALATAITEHIPPAKRTGAINSFLANTYNTLSIQMNRWLHERYFDTVERRFSITPADIRNASSGHFFTDRDLWYLTVLSDLSGLQQSGVKPATETGRKAFAELQNKRENIQKVFDLFLARTFLSPVNGKLCADLDKGYWKNYFDNRYAGYTGENPPVRWDKTGVDTWEMKTVVEWDSAYLRPDAGWDISHARRIVPALETFILNREYIKTVWGYQNPRFDPVALRHAFADQIVEKIWNKDTEYPLFSNFWSGDNGWYRVAYAARTGRRFAGYPPNGLSVAISEGGYPIWISFHPGLKTLFVKILQLSEKEDEASKSFVARHYQRLFDRSVANKLIEPIRNLAFLSDLVGH